MLWMLLEFVSALERALFNAVEGCCSCTAVADKTSSFFHTNRKVSPLEETVSEIDFKPVLNARACRLGTEPQTYRFTAQAI